MRRRFFLDHRVRNARKQVRDNIHSEDVALFMYEFAKAPRVLLIQWPPQNERALSEVDHHQAAQLDFPGNRRELDAAACGRGVSSRFASGGGWPDNRGRVHMATIATMTGSQFDALPYEEGRRWELLGGELIPVSSPTPEHQIILQRILFALMLHLQANPGQGLALTDVEFALNENSRVRPDVLLLLGHRANELDIQKVPMPGAPDLAVEIISPSERSSDTQEKLQQYLRNGTQEVWQVYPKSQSIVVHRGGQSTMIFAGQQLATPLLPGFLMEAKALFE